MVKPLLLAMILTVFLLGLPIETDAQKTFLQKVDHYYTAWTHPVETYIHANFKGFTSVEQQHVVPTSFAKMEIHPDIHELPDDLTVYWIRSNHTVSDRWKDKPVLSWKPSKTLQFLTLGSKRSLQNLWRVRTMGIYGLRYSLFFHEYNKQDSVFIPTHLDGMSNFIYGISWITNLPQKFLKQTAYILDPTTDPSLWYLIDVGVRLLILALEIPVAVIATLFGTVIGTIFHPINTLTSVLGGVHVLIGSTWIALKDSIVGLWLVLANLGKLVWHWTEPLGGWRWMILVVLILVSGAFSRSGTPEES